MQKEYASVYPAVHPSSEQTKHLLPEALIVTDLFQDLTFFIVECFTDYSV
jgi:hypothetical protein